jgi:hypothetical protein
MADTAQNHFYIPVILGSTRRGRQSPKDAAAAQGRARMMVPMLFRHRARTGGLRAIPARLRQAHLAARLAAVGLR